MPQPADPSKTRHPKRHMRHARSAEVPRAEGTKPAQLDRRYLHRPGEQAPLSIQHRSIGLPTARLPGWWFITRMGEGSGGEENEDVCVCVLGGDPHLNKKSA